MFVYVNGTSFPPKLPKDYKFPDIENFHENVRKEYEKHAQQRKDFDEARRKLLLD